MELFPESKITVLGNAKKKYLQFDIKSILSSSISFPSLVWLLDDLCKCDDTPSFVTPYACNIQSYLHVSKNNIQTSTRKQKEKPLR
jgi:hypothetical protein